MKVITTIIVLLLSVLFLASTVAYAGGTVTKQDKPKAATTAVQETQKHSPEKGSAACKEKHAKGECKGHEPGKCTCDKDPGACKDKHEKGECKGHEPGKAQKDKSKK